MVNTPVLVSGGTGIVVQLDELRRQVRLDSYDQDVDLTELCAAAVKYVENRTSRVLLTTVLDWTLPSFNAHKLLDDYQIQLPRTPVQSIDQIVHYDSAGVQQTLDSTWVAANLDLLDDGFLLPRIALKPDKTWPNTQARENAVTIRFTVGYGTAPAAMPADVKHAVKVLVSHMYEYRTPVIDGAAASKIPFTLDSMINQLQVGHYPLSV